MPGEITTTTHGQLRTKVVDAQFSAVDEDTLLSNGGQWPEGYVPQTVLRLFSRDSDNPNSPPQLITVGPGDGMSPALLARYRAGVREFFSMPACHILVGEIMRGEHVDGPGLDGGDAWRTRFAGVEYDMHDGSGTFTITEPEPAEEPEQ